LLLTQARDQEFLGVTPVQKPGFFRKSRASFQACPSGRVPNLTPIPEKKPSLPERRN
jgi:hypothetical protein